MLWECPAYDTFRSTFMEDLNNLLGESFEEFSALNNFERTGFVLGCENWERYDFKALLRLVKSFILLLKNLDVFSFHYLLPSVHDYPMNHS